VAVSFKIEKGLEKYKKLYSGNDISEQEKRGETRYFVDFFKKRKLFG
jgi:hypothetical protein